MRAWRLLSAAVLIPVLLTGCPYSNIPFGAVLLLENVAGGTGGTTPCTAGLYIRTPNNGAPSGGTGLAAGRSLIVPDLHDGPPGAVLDAYCDTGSGTPGHSQLSIPFSESRILRVTAPDGKPHDYVLQAPGPVIEVLR